MGRGDAPLGFPPWEILSWRNRFDDPERAFRTLYCAEQRRTALREVLADFRPNAKARAEYKELYGEDLPAPRIKAIWRQDRVLAQGAIRILKGDLIDIDEPGLRRQFEQQYKDLLAQHGLDHLDIAQIRNKDRGVTQTVARFVADRGGAGVVYGSNLDDLPCAALFEGRSLLIAVPGSDPEPLTLSHADLIAVCDEFELILADD